MSLPTNGECPDEVGCSRYLERGDSAASVRDGDGDGTTCDDRSAGGGCLVRQRGFPGVSARRRGRVRRALSIVRNDATAPMEFRSTGLVVTLHAEPWHFEGEGSVHGQAGRRRVSSRARRPRGPDGRLTGVPGRFEHGLRSRSGTLAPRHVRTEHRDGPAHDPSRRRHR
jgi:hypothetical protein